MRVGINIASHALNFGGGWKAAWWHIRALLDLKHDLTIFVTAGIHPSILPKLHGLPIRMYHAGVEAEFDGFLTINHFGYGLPLAKVWNCQHCFFPVNPAPPPEGLMLTSNSNYTASHIKDRWNRDAQTLYIPIEDYYHVGNKEKIIMHVSRFAEPNDWADKAHQQFIQVMRMFYRELPGWKLMLVGAVETEQHGYASALMKLAEGLPIDFIFNPTDEEMVDLYAKSALYWHATGISLPTIPSAQEHMGIAPLEAQASGCVPIVYRSGGMPEVVRENQTGLLFDDIRQLGQYTVDLTKQLSTWAAFQQYGLMWARSWQDYPSFVGRVQEMLEGQPISPLKNYIADMPFKQEDISCVIPTFNSPDVLKRCLDSLKRTAPRMPILVVNNGDPLPFEVEGVEVFEPGRNLGFAGAYKTVTPMLKTPLVLMLNDDTEAISSQWLAMMVLPFFDKSVGIVGGKLLFPDGRIQHAGGALDWSRPDVGFHPGYGAQDDLSLNQTRKVDFVTGAMMMVRRELFDIPEELVGGLCFEELWMSCAAREQGYNTVYQPAAMMLHHEGLTRKRTPEDEAKVERNKQAFKDRWMR